jgi:polyisoprenoid-binding protein YceI
MRKLALSFLPQMVCAALLAAASIPAQDTVLQFDPAETKVQFTLGDALHTVHGSFVLKRGNIRFNPLTGNAAGELVVDAASGASGSGARDRRMHQNILESVLFPEIVFRPDRVAGQVKPEGASQVEIHGVFLIHGAGHELTLPVAIEAAGGQYTATTHFALPYVAWGMKNPSNLLLRVSDKVEIAIQTVGRMAP